MHPGRWRIVRDLFEQVIELPEHERAARLETMCGSDTTLANEVRSLLAAHDAQTSGAFDRLGRSIAPLADVLEEDVPERVGPYVIIEEAGRGGMGVVYRAHDPRLQRDVALKFLPRSLLGDAASQQRFVDEARAASSLDHANICTIHDIGSVADGRLYIAMAWYGGGTLADRLRTGPIAPGAAIRIAAQVADALERAHRAGIVHRDIKPANIAFGEDGQARVLDFGIASLEADAAAPMAGTPRYMAPEQMRGDAVDRRTDIWSLGAVLYEMLTGTPPFPQTGAELKRAILAADAPPLERPHPPVLRAFVARALAGDPAMRHATAGEMATALRALVDRPRFTRRHAILATGIAVLVATTLFVTRLRSDAPPVDDGVVAIMPFRVSGDSTLAYLREGMVDLLSAKLTGEGGLRAADARAVHSAWRRSAGGDDADPVAASASVVAADVGAGNVLLGEVVGSAQALIVNTTVTSRRGRVLGRASVQGTLEELPALVDRVVAELLSLSAGEQPQRLAALTSTSLPALRAFLEGQAAYRRGRYDEALRGYGRALELDSTFALAGLGLELAGGWVGAAEDARARGRDVAWRHRARLSAPDQALLTAVLGPAYPRASTPRSQLDAIERSLQLSPDRVELWYMQGDTYFHFGRVLGLADWEARAEAAFRRALELDSAFSAPLHHLVALFARRHDHSQLAEMAALQLAREPAGATADYIRWRVAAARGGELPPLDGMADETLGWISMSAQDDAIEPAQALRALQLIAARPGTRVDRFERQLALHGFALNAGRPAEAASITQALLESQPDAAFVQRLRILDALWADGRRETAQSAAEQLGAAVEADERIARLNGCVHEQWRLMRDSLPPAHPAEGVRVDTDSPALILCDAVVDALREVGNAPGRAGDATLRLHHLVANGISDMPLIDGHVGYANSALAHVLERAGQPERALDAIGRRIYFLGWQFNLAASLRQEARLAAMVGDTARAIRALEQFLGLQYDPEPAQRAAVRQAQERLAALTRAG